MTLLQNPPFETCKESLLYDSGYVCVCVCVCVRERADEDKVMCRMAELFYIYILLILPWVTYDCFLPSCGSAEIKISVWALWMVLSISVKWAKVMNVHMWMHVRMRVSLRARTCVQACMHVCPLRYFGPRSFPRPCPFFPLIPFALLEYYPFTKHASLCFLYSFSSHALPTCQLA